MESILELLKKTSTFFEEKGIAEARLNAELIFAHVFGCKRLDLYLQFERPVSEEEKAQLRPFLTRRAGREPIQYVLGEADFMGNAISVDKRVLIPRPETEELVERVASILSGVSPISICDLGTGSGCISIALAKLFPCAEVTAIDQSPAACELARLNVKKLGLSHQINVLQSNWFDELAEAKFDLIVSNPPYLTQEEWETAEAEVRDFEPYGALVGSEANADGYLKHIIKHAPAFLKPNGRVAFETGIAQHAELQAYAATCGFKKAESFQDMQGRDRFVVLALA